MEVEYNQLCELRTTADFLAIESLLDLALSALACRIRRWRPFKLGTIPNTVTILLLTEYLTLEDVQKMDVCIRKGKCGVAEGRAPRVLF